MHLVGLVWPALGLLILGLCAFFPLPLHHAFASAWLDALHFPAAALLLYALMLYTRLTRSSAFILALVLLVVLELVQPYVGRSGQWQDIIHGLWGLVVVFWWSRFSVLSRSILLLVSTSVVGLPLATLYGYQYQLRQHLPSLMSQASHPSFGWQALNGSKVQHQPTASQQVQWAIALTPSQWQGLSWKNPALYFDQSHQLCFTARANQATTLVIRLDDHDSTDYASRFNTEVQLQAFWLRYCLSFNNMYTTERRRLDTTKLQQIYFFAKGTSTQAWFALADVTIGPKDLP